MYSYLHENREESKVTREIVVIGRFDDGGCPTIWLLGARMQGPCVLLV